MKDKLEKIKKQFNEDLKKIASETDVQHLQEKYFSRKKGVLTIQLKELKNISNLEERKSIGQLANKIKNDLENNLINILESFNRSHSDLTNFDTTLPGIPSSLGHIHPLRQVQKELVDIFYSMGFMITEGNELENEDYCFNFLNIPPTHPARDLQDTFYIKPKHRGNEVQVLRTHTSNMQVRIMEKFTPPLRVVVPGRIFRNEAIDASHEHTFYQMEGFVVDKNISVANLTYVLKTAMSKILAQDVKVRLRPGYFPYVEPGFEADCSCTICHGKGCAVCSYTGWVEMLGCGMIHPKVFESAGYPIDEYTGFAFGIGVNRLAMLKYNIDDIRWLMSGDLRFNKQF